MCTSTTFGRRSGVITTLLVLVALLMALLPARSADARSRYMSRVTGRTASTSWTQIDGTSPGSSPVGNVHIGWLNAYETSRGKADVFVKINDFDCEPGRLPGWGAYHKEPKDDGCTYLGKRVGSGSGLKFTMNGRLRSARLVGASGELLLYGGGHGDTGVVGRPALDIVWTGTGSLSTQRVTYEYQDGGSWYKETYRSSYRNAVMSGTMGPMGFDPAYSSGSMSNFKYASSGGSR